MTLETAIERDLLRSLQLPSCGVWAREFMRMDDDERVKKRS